MDWSDRGIVLSAKKHGETSLIVQLLTERHGRHAGLVRGGTSSRARGLYQPGNLLAAHWRARLAEHLGNYTCEMVTSSAATLLDNGGKLAALSSAAALAEAALPEREPHEDVFRSFSALVEALAAAGKPDSDWAPAYVRFELGLLASLGFGLDLERCAATGANDNLAFVSPKTGRAVSLSAGEAWRDKLLVLPRFLLAGSGADAPPAPGEVGQGLALTGYFLERHVFAPHGKGLPAARVRLGERLARA
ncbi:MAG TPA: DNA repair protein RecO [Alphaproteobacteria bacterium]|jgi:DNA repair protein RecO (recombination protein O)